MEIGRNIAALRKKQGLTQTQLAERLGVSDKAVSKWERGLSCPDISLLVELASALGTSTDALLGEAELTEKDFLSVEKYFMGNYGYVVPDRIPDGTRVVLLLDSPDLDECQHGYPLSGKAGAELSRYLFGEDAPMTPARLSERGLGAVYVSNVPLWNLDAPVAPLVSELEFIRLNRDHIDRCLAERFVPKMKALLAREDIQVLGITRWFNQKYFAYFLSRATPDELASLEARVASGTLRILFVGLPSLWNSENSRQYAGQLALKEYYQ